MVVGGDVDDDIFMRVVGCLTPFLHLTHDHKFNQIALCLCDGGPCMHNKGLSQTHLFAKKKAQPRTQLNRSNNKQVPQDVCENGRSSWLCG